MSRTTDAPVAPPSKYLLTLHEVNVDTASKGKTESVSLLRPPLCHIPSVHLSLWEAWCFNSVTEQEKIMTLTWHKPTRKLLKWKACRGNSPSTDLMLLILLPKQDSLTDPWHLAKQAVLHCSFYVLQSSSFELIEEPWKLNAEKPNVLAPSASSSYLYWQRWGFKALSSSKKSQPIWKPATFNLESFNLSASKPEFAETKLSAGEKKSFVENLVPKSFSMNERVAPPYTRAHRSVHRIIQVRLRYCVYEAGRHQ